MAIARLSRNELTEMIETVEAEGGDVTELKNLLAQVDEDARLKQPARRRYSPPSTLLGPGQEEPTTAERLNNEVGDFYPGGISDEQQAKIIEMDRNHNQKELQAMCREAGLSPSGHKKKLAAKLIAYGLGYLAERGGDC